MSPPFAVLTICLHRQIAKLEQEDSALRAISLEGLAVFQPTLNPRNHPRQSALIRRYALAQQTIKVAPRLLKPDFSANPVSLFGSLLAPPAFISTLTRDLRPRGCTTAI